MKLQIKGLKVKAQGNQILKGVDLEVGNGEVHVVMGPNGSGKSTLAQVIAGNPAYEVSGGWLMVNGKNITKLSPDRRASLGIFLGFQNPVEIPGVSVFNVLRRAVSGPVSGRGPAVSSLRTKRSNLSKALPGSGQVQNVQNGIASSFSTPRNDINKVSQFRQQLLEYASSLKLSPDHLSRSFNEGFSGGEKKRNEILQMLALSPKLVILDEIDSGLDVDGLKIVAEAIKQFRHNDPVSSLILITHYARILKYIKADFVHVMVEGKIVKSGKQELAGEIEEKGYQFVSG